MASTAGVGILRRVSRRPFRRYELEKPELNRAIEELVDAVETAYGRSADAERVRQLLVSTLRLVHDGASRANLKLLNNAFKELRHAFRVFAPYESMRKVAVFGSARTARGHADWEQARAFAERIAGEGWMVITGAGDGIMGAAQGGAGREASFGVNIRLPFEQRANEVIAGDRKLINFRYFFTRKLVFVKEAHALALFPGGFGTHDEGFEALTLMQTGKSEILPVLFVDAPGGSYWRDWQEYVRTHLCGRALIDEDDLSLFRVTDDVGAAVDEIVGFYRNYHSSRYIGDLLVIRARVAPDAAQLERLNADFGDIVTRGAIEVSATLPEEAGEVDRSPRVTLHFDRRRVGRLRELIDRLNALVPEPAAPLEASPHEIVADPLPPEAERAEQDEG